MGLAIASVTGTSSLFFSPAAAFTVFPATFLPFMSRISTATSTSPAFPSELRRVFTSTSALDLLKDFVVMKTPGEA